MWVLVIFFALIAGAAGLKLMREGAAPASQAAGMPKTSPAAYAPLHSGPVGEPMTRRAVASIQQFRGLTLQLQNSDPDHPYETYIDQIAALGANTIMFVVTAYQENASSTSLVPAASKTPTNRHIERLMAHAHSKGLQVVFMPIVLLENPRAGEWRGKISPEDWDAWWARYYDYVLMYAKVAERGKAEAFIVGSELVSTEKQAYRWRELIRLVRANFAGLLTYSANWDHYTVPEWWDDLDMVGMTSYHDLEVGDDPSVEDLVKAWQPIKQKILDWQKTVNMPILFTEIGWPNQTTCARKPWNYYGAPDKPAPQLQAKCFEAFFKTWMDELAVGGTLIWEWRNYPGMVGGPEETGYIPCGKPAEKVIADYFRSAKPSHHPVLPATKPATKPATRPASNPATKPAAEFPEAVEEGDLGL